MPLVRIDLAKGQSDAYHRRLGECIQNAMHEALGVPMAECFHVITIHPPGTLRIDPTYLGIVRSDEAVVVQVYLNTGRDATTKEHFFATLAAKLHEGTGLRPEDLVISLVEVKPEDWSFGNGQAQLAHSAERAP